MTNVTLKRFSGKLRRPRLQWTILGFLSYLAISYIVQKTKGTFNKEDTVYCQSLKYSQYIKDCVCIPSLPTNLDDLKHRMTTAMKSVDRDMLIRVWEESQFRLYVSRHTAPSVLEITPPSRLLHPFDKQATPLQDGHIYPLLWTASRHLLAEPSSSEEEETETTSDQLLDSSEKSSSGSEQGSSNCTSPAIEQFPKPMMSQKIRQNGGLLLHILATIYLFVAIAIVCDEFFVPSLEMICDRLNMSEDVAGATFMAAGSSAPELATAVIAVFVAEDDIGISGVIGSAVFNILFVISVCAIFAGHVVDINWWPLIRDSFCYCISICALLMTIYNEKVTWYDSVFLLILYALYIVLMFHNTRMEEWANTLNVPFKRATREEKSSLFGVNTSVSGGQPGEKDQSAMVSIQGESVEGSEEEIWEITSPLLNRENGNATKSLENTEIEAAQPKSMVPEKKDEDISPWEMPVGVWERIVWIITLPIVAVHYVSVPDARKVRWRRWFMVTFVMSMVWIAVYSYIMVWMITIIGFTMGIPDTVMGLTLIAVGVSVPDALSSLCVVKQGFGDMAVSNAIGSNVFDILICLGLPWFLKTVIVDPGSIVPVESRGLTYSTISLFSTVIFLIVATHLNGWKLDFKYGVVLLIWYLIFMLFASLYELNVFGEFNLPVCPSKY